MTTDRDYFLTERNGKDRTFFSVSLMKGREQEREARFILLFDEVELDSIFHSKHATQVLQRSPNDVPFYDEQEKSVAIAGYATHVSGHFYIYVAVKPLPLDEATDARLAATMASVAYQVLQMVTNTGADFPNWNLLSLLTQFFYTERQKALR